MRIVDTHHHLWDLKAHHYPWLTDRVVPKIYGDYAAIRRDYLIGDYLADLDSTPVVKSVHVNAGIDPHDPVRETSWLQAIADDHPVSRGFPHAIIGEVDLLAIDVEAVLHQHRRFANFRGIRQTLSGIVTDPANHPDITRHPVWWRNIQHLAPLSLSLDLQVHPRQMQTVASIAEEHRDLQLIICHAGLPTGLASGDLDEWRSGMASISNLPNIAVKISGLGMFDTARSYANIRAIVLETVDLFGTNRTMFGTNYPVDSLFGDYPSIWEAFNRATSAIDADGRARLFAGNAERIYRI